MKIRSLTDSIQGFHRVSEKEEKGGAPDQESQYDQNNQKKEEPTLEVTPEVVGQAIEAFTHDRQTQDTGIQASLTGQGPGLRVILKDGSGAVIRQLSGEEFLKLRDAVSKDTKTRGKILDQKA